MKKLPKARTENLLEQNLEKETLIYDLTIDKAFNLNETLTIVYKACGQNQAFEDLKKKHKFTDDFIYLALDELKRNNLLAGEYSSPFANTNRREVIKKVGLATMFALPIITGLVAPKAINAASRGGSGLPEYLDACVQPYYDPDTDTTRGGCAGLLCRDTLNGLRCCYPGGVGLALNYLAGETYYIDTTGEDTNFAIRPLGSTPEAGECRGASGCCTGSAPTASCEYVPYTGDAFTEEEIEEYRQSGWGVYWTKCTCSC